jgi:hypothetical protein
VKSTVANSAKYKRAIAKSWQFWSVFASCQTLGIAIPAFTNIHSNIWPLFGCLLLVPGIAIPFMLDFLPLWVGLAIAVALNALVWFVLATTWDAAQPKQGSE